MEVSAHMLITKWTHGFITRTEASNLGHTSSHSRNINPIHSPCSYLFTLALLPQLPSMQTAVLQEEILTHQGFKKFTVSQGNASDLGYHPWLQVFSRQEQKHLNMTQQILRIIDVSLIWLTGEIVGFHKPLKIMSCFKHRQKYHCVLHNNVYTRETWSTLNYICLCQMCPFSHSHFARISFWSVRDANEDERRTNKKNNSILAEAQFSPWANSELPFQMRSLTSLWILMTFIDVFNNFFLSVGY